MLQLSTCAKAERRQKHRSTFGWMLAIALALDLAAIKLPSLNQHARLQLRRAPVVGRPVNKWAWDTDIGVMLLLHLPGRGQA
jgi:hypothetical protein